MRNGIAAIAFAVAASLPALADAARVCGGGSTASTGTFQLRIIEFRYDGPDPLKGNNISTIAATVSNSATPLYECVAQWPESWAGWYDGGDKIIWSDCIWTGAGSGADKTVSFAVDWKTKAFYLSHTFACSDKPGFDGLATGIINLNLSCATLDGAVACIPPATSTGARPDLRLETKLTPEPLTATSACADNAKRYQSWRVEKWQRQFEMAPGSLPPGVAKPPAADTGPSFTLRSMANNGVFACTTAGQKDSVFEGTCKAESQSPVTAATFTFDPKLQYITVSQMWNCDNSTSFGAVGVGYMQAVCDKNFNSDVFTCTSDPVWIGTGTL